eukprot:CAMPEP_0206385430 /NCGR_PEP_ID=MMETSP0294-20121207/15262_1 /ASSEMBLY_ACC=CAM_ASM_000327 /TAXON_ID=39354 /ORGANISM="Heterosigma akashiwo, Strain CCMP2393" /LENGTH=297 /DNA_ID=CAMNT_0053836123 /DNA_START=20 /DNA_END=910 /DNA_ORIENTATION=+
MATTDAGELHQIDVESNRNGEVQQAPKFKSRKKKPKGNIRKRKKGEDDDEDNGEIEGSTGMSLEEIRKEQQLRRRIGGIQAEVSTGRKKKEGEDEEEEEEEVAMVGEDVEYGLRDKKQAKKELERLMEGQFTGQVAGKDKQQEMHEKLLDDYIQEQMGTKKEEEKAPELGEEDKLYLLPNELKPESTAENLEEAVEAGAPLAYNTGIAEVTLPMEFKLQNIERTEKLRQLLQERGESEVDTRPGWMKGSTNVPGSLTANYAAHKLQWMANLRLKREAEGRPDHHHRGGGGGGGKGGD